MWLIGMCNFLAYFFLGADLINDFLNFQCRKIFAKANRPYWSSNLVTNTEVTLTAWIGVITIK